MLQLFSKNHFLNTLLFIPIIIVLHQAVFIREQVYNLQVNKGGYLGEMMLSWFSTYPKLAGVLACLLIFIQIVLINRISIVNKMSNAITLYAGMVYMVLTMLMPDFLVLSPAMIAMTFMLLSISYLMRAFKIMNAPTHVFNAGFWIAVASLFYSSLLVFFIWGYISFVILRRFKSVEGLRYIIGFIVPYIWVVTLVFFGGDMSEFLSSQFISYLGFPTLNLNMSPVTYIPLIIFTILTLYASFSYTQLKTKKSIHAQKKYSILYWFLLFALVSGLFTEYLDSTHLFFVALPLSFFLAELIVLMENKSIGELIVWILIIIGVALQYGFLT